MPVLNVASESRGVSPPTLLTPLPLLDGAAATAALATLAACRGAERKAQSPRPACEPCAPVTRREREQATVTQLCPVHPARAQHDMRRRAGWCGIFAAHLAIAVSRNVRLALFLLLCHWTSPPARQPAAGEAGTLVEPPRACECAGGSRGVWSVAVYLA
eukprot:scaffold10585_cov32-Tisochrysis_lutea.AAC.1